MNCPIQGTNVAAPPPRDERFLWNIVNVRSKRFEARRD